MNFDLNPEQQLIVDTAGQLGRKYGPDYWRRKDQNAEHPQEFLDEVGELGFFGMHLPERWGGGGAGVTELVLAMEALCGEGGGGGPALGFLFGILGSNALLHHGNEDQLRRYLPPMAKGEILASLAITEPNAGTNTLNIETFAERRGDRYLIRGAKWFTTNILETQLCLLLACTARGQGAKGLSLFLVDLPASGIQAAPIPKHGFHYYRSYNVQFDSLEVPVCNLLGAEGRGFQQMLATLNHERLLVGAAALGTGRLALGAAVEYANQRTVFQRPIGAHQGVQHPLAAAHAHLRAAWLAVLQAAAWHDAGKSAAQTAQAANVAKYLAAEAAVDACYHSMQTLGGAGFAAEYHIERWWREVQLYRLAPLTQQMSLNFIGEHALGLPKSY